MQTEDQNPGDATGEAEAQVTETTAPDAGGAAGESQAEERSLVDEATAILEGHSDDAGEKPSGDEEETPEEGAETSEQDGEGTDDEEETTSEDDGEPGDAKDDEEFDAPDAKDEETKDRDDRLSRKEFKALPKKAQRRINSLYQQARAAEEKFEGVSDRVERYDRLTEFTTRNRISNDHFKQLMTVGALIANQQHEKVVEALRPFYERALQASGQSLAAEYQRLVDDGELSEERAKELQAAKFRTERAELTAKQAEEEREAARRETQANEVREAIVTSVSERLRELAQTDPDFEAKRPEIDRIARQQAQAYPPKDAAAAVEMLNSIYDTVTSAREAFKPKPKPTMPRPTGGSNPSRAQAEPKTMLDAAVSALEGMANR